MRVAWPLCSLSFIDEILSDYVTGVVMKFTNEPSQQILHHAVLLHSRFSSRACCGALWVLELASASCVSWRIAVSSPRQLHPSSWFNLCLSGLSVARTQGPDTPCSKSYQDQSGLVCMFGCIQYACFSTFGLFPCACRDWQTLPISFLLARGWPA